MDKPQAKRKTNTLPVITKLSQDSSIITHSSISAWRCIMSKTKKKVDLSKPLSLHQRLDALTYALSKDPPYSPIASCYRTLGVSETATFTEVQRAYKQKLRKYDLYKKTSPHIKPGSGADICRTRILEKIKEAYRKICESLDKDL
jgi:hypothetical protein